MKFKGKGSTNAGKHFNELLENNPEYWSEVNTTRIKDGLVAIVDEQFANYFSRYRDRIGDKLIQHHIGGGGQAAAVPETLHKGFGGVHNIEKDNGIRGNDILTNIAETLSKYYKK